MGKLTTKRMTEKALIANRANARRPGAGRPKGSMSADKIALRDRCRVKDSEHVSYLEHIAANDKSGAVDVREREYPAPLPSSNPHESRLFNLSPTTRDALPFPAVCARLPRPKSSR